MTQKQLLEAVLVELGNIKEGLPNGKLKAMMEDVKELKDDMSDLKYTLLNPEEGVIVKTNKNSEFRTMMQENERDFQAHLQLGIVLFKEEDFEQAKFHLLTANSMLPSYTGYPSPALVLAQIFEREGNQQERLKWLEVLLENLQHDYDSAVLLAEDALENENFERANYYIDRAIQVDPYRSGVHELKARYADEIGDAELAVTEYEVLLKLEINDPVEARTDLAEAYLNNGQLDKAKESVLYALEIAPSYRRAQEVLLESISGDGS